MKRHNDESREIPKPDFSNFNIAVAVRPGPVCKSVRDERRENEEFVRRISATTSSSTIFGFVEKENIRVDASVFIAGIRDSRDFRSLSMVSKHPIRDLAEACNISNYCVSRIMNELFGVKYIPLITLYLSKIEVPMYVVYREMQNLKPMQFFVDACEFIDNNTLNNVKPETQGPKRRRLFGDSEENLYTEL